MVQHFPMVHSRSILQQQQKSTMIRTSPQASPIIESPTKESRNSPPAPPVLGADPKSAKGSNPAPAFVHGVAVPALLGISGAVTATAVVSAAAAAAFGAGLRFAKRANPPPPPVVVADMVIVQVRYRYGVSRVVSRERMATAARRCKREDAVMSLREAKASLRIEKNEERKNDKIRKLFHFGFQILHKDDVSA